MLLPWWQMEWPPRVGCIWQMLKPWWQMELPLVSFISNLVLRCLTEPYPRSVADGTCLHFYLGMDY